MTVEYFEQVQKTTGPKVKLMPVSKRKSYIAPSMSSLKTNVKLS